MQHNIDVDTVYDVQTLFDWCVANGIINPNETYDESSDIAPRDEQTVLNNGAVFELTNYPRNNGRRIYRKIGTNELWVVDGSRRHAGAKAHIEVFDENTKLHLGTSLYNEIQLDTKYRKSNRDINLEN